MILQKRNLLRKKKRKSNPPKGKNYFLKEKSLLSMKSKLLSLISLVVCAACHSPLTVPRQNHSVLFFDYAVHCAHCNKDLVSEEKDEYKQTGKNGKVQSFVKRTIGAVYGTMCSGKGHATFARITTSIGLKQLARNQFHKYKKLIFAVAKAVLFDHLKAFCALIIWNHYVHVL